MLSKTYCLKRKKDFEKILKEGKGFKEDFLVLKFVKNNLKNSRFGIIVSQKISKKATIRNKIKRRIRALIYSKLPKIRENIDGVLITLPGLENQDFWEIEKTIDKIFEKARILKSKCQNPNAK